MPNQINYFFFQTEIFSAYLQFKKHKMITVSQHKFTRQNGWEQLYGQQNHSDANLVLVFGSTQLVKENAGIDTLKAMYPKAIITGCSSSGEIAGTKVFDDTLVATAITFEKTNLKFWSHEINDVAESVLLAQKLVKTLLNNDLNHIFLISEGLVINGSDLVSGIRCILPEHISVTGGLAGDGSNFKETFVYANGLAKNKTIAAIGFYGSSIQIGYGSFGGWDSFGIERLVTKSDKNVLYELDGEPALKLYKSFLGEYANGLPASGLLFPLSLRDIGNENPVVRTILGVNEDEQSLTFAGNIPEGSYVRLMKANVNHLIDGAGEAAKITASALKFEDPDVAICISCVGRRLVLKQLVEEEIDGIRETLGTKPVICGFYSYGEISPFSNHARCELHNQTMTITTFKEI